MPALRSHEHQAAELKPNHLRKTKVQRCSPEGDFGGTVKPLAVELFAGSFGWSAGLVAEGYRVVGFDIEHLPHHGPVPEGCSLVLQDVLTLHGSQFKNAAVIVASPPCQKYSWLAMPWSRSKPAKCKACGGKGKFEIIAESMNLKEIPCVKCGGRGETDNSQAAKALRKEWETNGPDNRLFEACLRIQREAIEGTRNVCVECGGKGYTSYCGDDDSWCRGCKSKGYKERYIPLVIENVRGAQEWVGAAFYGLDAWMQAGPAERWRMGRSAWNFGSFHLWGDVPALMPIGGIQKRTGRNFHTYTLTGGAVSSPSFHGAEHETIGVGMGVQVASADGGRRTDIGKGARFTSRDCGVEAEDGTKIGGDWFSDPACHSKHGSRSSARKAVSAAIARIPFELARHIAAVYKPRTKTPENKWLSTQSR